MDDVRFNTGDVLEKVEQQLTTLIDLLAALGIDVTLYDGAPWCNVRTPMERQADWGRGAKP